MEGREFLARDAIPLVDLKMQYISLKNEIDAASLRVMGSGRYINGPETEAFETEFAEYCGVDYCVAVGSGTAALNLTLRSLNVGPGSEVITPAFTISATLDAIVDLGAVPILVDVDPLSYTIDPDKLLEVITPQTRAILPVHAFGHPSDMDQIIGIADAHGVAVVSDACEAHGSFYKEQHVVSLGTASCISFYPTKNLGAFGDAGAVLTNDVIIAENVRLLRYHGWSSRFQSAVSSMNSRMDEIQAAILRTKLPHLADWNDRRRAIAVRYDLALSQSGVQPAPAEQWSNPAYYIYVARTHARDRLCQILNDAGISTDIHWPTPPHLQPAFAHLGYREGMFPVTEQLCREVLTLPIYPELMDSEVAYICQTISKFSP
jgi:dTDP-4-amino-4,6-dideoxygalactose transaminase